MKVFFIVFHGFITVWNLDERGLPYGLADEVEYFEKRFHTCAPIDVSLIDAIGRRSTNKAHDSDVAVPMMQPYFVPAGGLSHPYGLQWSSVTTVYARYQLVGFSAYC